MNRLRADVSFAIISYSYLLLLSLFLSLSLINHTKHAAVTALYESAQQLISVRKITIIIDVISLTYLIRLVAVSGASTTNHLALSCANVRIHDQQDCQDSPQSQVRGFLISPPYSTQFRHHKPT